MVEKPGFHIKHIARDEMYRVKNQTGGLELSNNRQHFEAKISWWTLLGSS